MATATVCAPMLASVSGGWLGLPGTPLSSARQASTPPDQLDLSQYTMNNPLMGQGPDGGFEALADPIRLRIARHLAAHGPASIGDLPRVVGAHPNTVRAHTAALERAGLLQRGGSAARGRGRPVVLFRLHDDMPPPDVDRHALAALLASAAGRSLSGRAVAKLRSIGAAWGRARAGGDREVIDGLGRLGFRTRVDGERLELSACPCPLVAPAYPAIVCELAHGAAEGILAGSGRRVRSAEHDPARRRCVLHLGNRKQTH
jgi:predicted ArsR family transcriptional regulator